ncbi:MAG: phosphate acyltransferase [Thermoleophilaceae bacterium]
MIAVDANGADRGPAAVAEGARQAGVPVTIYGPVSELGEAPDVVDAPETIGPDEPVTSVRSRPEASVVRAARAVADGSADAVVSAGSTAPALAAAVLNIKRLRGVHRPAIAALLPLPGGSTLLLDAGASAEARPEHLVQFAYMGAAFMEAVHGVERPRVGLLSNGEGAGKGTPAVVAANQRLASAVSSSFEFLGNVEGTDLAAGAADVVVADGFTGNVALKTMEGTVRTVVGAIGDAVRSSPVSSLGGLLIRGRVGALRSELDPNSVGGAILLGLRHVVVIAHGSSTADGVAQAVRVAGRAVDERVVDRTRAALAAGDALRSAPAGSVSEQP